NISTKGQPLEAQHRQKRFHIDGLQQTHIAVEVKYVPAATQGIEERRAGREWRSYRAEHDEENPRRRDIDSTQCNRWSNRLHRCYRYVSRRWLRGKYHGWRCMYPWGRKYCGCSDAPRI